MTILNRPVVVHIQAVYLSVVYFIAFTNISDFSILIQILEIMPSKDVTSRRLEGQYSVWKLVVAADGLPRHQSLD